MAETTTKPAQGPVRKPMTPKAKPAPTALPRKRRRSARGLALTTPRERARHLISDHALVDVGQVTDDAMLGFDLGFDSLDFTECVMDLEREFGIAIDEDLTDDLWGGEQPGRGTAGAVLAAVERLAPARLKRTA